jgi:4-amino-4-deoxy-L-arabinose transferase-like glycosyltransferase
MSAGEISRDRAWLAFGIIAAAQVLLWTIVPALTFDAPPLDVTENIMWGREWLWGTYKHPPLQAWITELALILSGNHVIGIYLVSQVCIVLTWLALFMFALDVSTPRTAILSVFFFSIVYYSSVPSAEFNANVVQMPIWAWSFYLVWRCIQENRLRDWLLLGLVGALAVYAKYSAALLFLTWLAAFGTHWSPRKILLNPAMWAGAIVAALLVSPHLYWLHESGYQPLHYAEARSLPAAGIEGILLALKFLATQVLDHVATFLIMLCLGGLALFRGLSFRTVLQHPAGRMITIAAFTPLLFAVLFAIIRGVQLKDMWAAPMVVMISLWLAMQVPASIPAWRTRVALIVGGTLFALAPLGVGGVSLFGPAMGMKPQKTSWPQSRIVAEVRGIWEGQVEGAPLRIVGGPTWPSAMVVAGLERATSGFVDCSFVKNPWVTKERLGKEGMMVVWSGSEETACLSTMQVDKRGTFSVEPVGGIKQIQIYWALQRPRDGG